MANANGTPGTLTPAPLGNTRSVKHGVYSGRVLAPRGEMAAATAAGVGWAGPHALRHTCATRLFRAGMNAKQVQLWLGHHSPAFMLAVYVHLLADDLPDPDFFDRLGHSLTSPTRPMKASAQSSSSVASAVAVGRSGGE